MWTLIDNGTRHHSGQNVVDSRGAAEWVHKITKEIFVKISPTRTYANELLVRVRLSCQELLQTRSTCTDNAKKMFGKRVVTSTLVDKSTDHDKPHFDLFFYRNMNVKINIFFQSASWIDASSVVWTLIDNGKLANQIARLAAIVVKNILLFQRNMQIIKVRYNGHLTHHFIKQVWEPRMQIHIIIPSLEGLNGVNR